MEDSVRKSFEGFELPVSDTDWSRIAAALDEKPVRKGFWYWLKGNRRWGIPVLLILLLSSSVFTYKWMKDSKPADSAANTSQLTTTAKSGSNPAKSDLTEKATASGGAENSASETETVNSVADKIKETVKSTNDFHRNPDLKKVSGKTTVTPETPATSPNIGTGDPVNDKKTTAVPTEGARLAHLPASFGLRTQTFISRPGRARGFPLSLKPVVAIKPPKTDLGLGYYASLQTTFDPGKVSYTTPTGIWQGFTWLNGSNPALDLRLEGGIEMGTENLKFTIGAALEGNPLQTKSSDTIRIKVADRFVPYMDIHGNILFYLAVRWRDSVIVLRNNPNRLWAEIPLGIRKSFELSKDFKLIAGITANPGVLLGTNAKIANPYLTHSGSYWDYNYGVKNADTTSATIDAGEFVNPLRMGAGIQLGIQKDLKHINWGIQLQSRYYFTPVWKSGVPLKQNTLQYGINVKVGFKI